MGYMQDLPEDISLEDAVDANYDLCDLQVRE